MEIFSTIIPIFAVIAIGWAARQKGFIPEEFLRPANQLVYYVAIPAMIFLSISQGSMIIDFNSRVAILTLIPLVIFFFVAWGAGSLVHMKSSQSATFIQSSYHGNLGYIGLAVAYYFLGDRGLASAGILAGFLMILQNFLSVFILQYYGGSNAPGRRAFEMLQKIVGNPVIFSAFAGILFSAFKISLHPIIIRTLDIISGMALPLALLLIGASLSLRLIGARLFAVLTSGLLKLILLPGVGFFLYRLWGIPASAYLPGLILLAAPTATITYVMAGEMNGDSDFAVAAISTSTLFSALTFLFWLHLAR
ncbi:MAG: AEC family transporter [Desulfobacteraceae bacterium]|nr:AEC family transporter [Desulfobacteraceae bacterium]MCF8095377.1 AEC family transporter [Desulfobacteraceae bacterium]